MGNMLNEFPDSCQPGDHVDTPAASGLRVVALRKLLLRSVLHVLHACTSRQCPESSGHVWWRGRILQIEEPVPTARLRDSVQIRRESRRHGSDAGVRVPKVAGQCGLTERIRPWPYPAEVENLGNVGHQER